LKEGSIVRLGEQSRLKMVVLHTPGHSQGSVCFLLVNKEERDGVNGEAQNSIISGDAATATHYSECSKFTLISKCLLQRKVKK
jgi:glyoxylase-like metal-dependent hydrolase (beta-lactamase superfamily II)